MPTISVLFDTRRKTATGDYPVRIQLYHQKKQFLVATKLTATPAVYNRYKENRCKTTQSRQLKDKIDAELNKCRTVIEQLGTFSIQGFRKLYNSESGIRRKSTTTSVRSLFDDKITALKKNNKFNTASNYNSGLRNILAFAKSYGISDGELVLEDITPPWLASYEQWNITKGNANVPDPNSKRTAKRNGWSTYRDNPVVTVRTGNSMSTVRCYLRTLRTVFNDAIADRLIAPSTYPFGKRRYKVGASGSTKKVLTKDQLRSLMNYNSKPEYNAARDFWFWLYYSNGMNAMDALHLRKENIYQMNGEEFIRFRRRKTQFSSTEAGEIDVHIKPMMKEVMKHYTVKDNPYIFNVINDQMSAEEKFNIVCEWKQQCNLRLKQVGKALGFPLSLKLSRSTFATELRNAGIPVAFISRMMGHTSLSTTEIYMASLPNDKLVEISESLNTFQTEHIKAMKKDIDDLVIKSFLPEITDKKQAKRILKGKEVRPELPERPSGITGEQIKNAIRNNRRKLLKPCN